MKPGSIYVDFDDVLCETAKALMEVANREFGRQIVFDDICSFNIGEAFHLTLEQVDYTMRFLHEPDAVMGLAPMEGARSTLLKWRQQGCEIHVVTGRPPVTAAPSLAWLDRHGFPYDQVDFVDKYNRFDHTDGAPTLSLDELRAKRFTLAVEDAPEMLDFLFTQTDSSVAVFDRPWNLGSVVPDPIPGRRFERCRGWAEVAGKFAFRAP